MFHPVAGSEFAAVALVEDSGVFNDDVDIEIELQLLEQVTDRVVVKADQPFFPQEIIVLGDRGGFKLPVFHVGLFVGFQEEIVPVVGRFDLYRTFQQRGLEDGISFIGMDIELRT